MYTVEKRYVDSYGSMSIWDKGFNDKDEAMQYMTADAESENTQMVFTGKLTQDSDMFSDRVIAGYILERKIPDPVHEHSHNFWSHIWTLVEVPSHEIKCDDCGVTHAEDDSVNVTVDPYYFQMHGDEYEYIACNECYYERCRDV